MSIKGSVAEAFTAVIFEEITFIQFNLIDLIATTPAI